MGESVRAYKIVVTEGEVVDARTCDQVKGSKDEIISTFAVCRYVTTGPSTR